VEEGIEGAAAGNYLWFPRHRRTRAVYLSESEEALSEFGADWSSRHAQRHVGMLSSVTIV
jgi:hypothetical protein